MRLGGQTIARIAAEWTKAVVHLPTVGCFCRYGYKTGGFYLDRLINLYEYLKNRG